MHRGKIVNLQTDHLATNCSFGMTVPQDYHEMYLPTFRLQEFLVP